MPRRRMMDMRNPYGARGGYVSSRRSRRDRAMEEDMRRGRDRLMMDDMRAYNRGESDYELADLTRQNQEIIHDPYMPRDYETGEVYAGIDDFYGETDMARGRSDYASNRRNRSDYARDYARSMGRDGHYPMGQGSTYYPIEAMGRFTGYYGMGEDYARGGRGRDYGYDYNYDYAGDYGETLTEEELKRWCQKMMSELDEREKQMFSKEAILQRAKNIGIQFDKFSEMEFYVNVVKNYTDHKKSIGENPDMAVKLARDDFNDEDGEYKGSEWLAIYFDTFVKQDD